LLNQAARYFPILRILREQNLATSDSVLEIGSGPVGLGQFRKIRFVGCDLSFLIQPQSPMVPLIASAAALPFHESSFDVVIASDVLEHVPSIARQVVIAETLRVARKLVIFAFPCGEIAHNADRKLLETYVSKNLEPPSWLREHMLEDFPEPDLFQSTQDWTVTRFGNENIQFHSWMMRLELFGAFNYGMRGGLRLVPQVIESVLRKADYPPFYRQIFLLRRVRG